jgi:hypothetical protein
VDLDRVLTQGLPTCFALVQGSDQLFGHSQQLRILTSMGRPHLRCDFFLPLVTASFGRTAPRSVTFWVIESATRASGTGGCG